MCENWAYDFDNYQFIYIFKEKDLFINFLHIFPKSWA